MMSNVCDDGQQRSLTEYLMRTDETHALSDSSALEVEMAVSRLRSTIAAP